MAYLNQNEIQSILEVIENQTALFVGTSIGTQYLSDVDKERLESIGINHEELYKLSNDPIFLNFQLGMISGVVGEKKANKLDYTTLKKIVQSGGHIDLNQRELATLDSVKQQTLSDIRGKGNKIFQDFTNILNEQNLKGRAGQEEFIRTEIYEGLEKRKAVKEITRELHKKTGDWNRDFGRIVGFVSHKALSEGRASIIRRKAGGDGRVYMIVQSTACKYCNKHYLTNGAGSAPRIFTLDTLEANGTNIGRKVADLKPVNPGLHPNCRCHMTEYRGGEWDGNKFVHKGEYKSKVRKNKTKIRVGEEEFQI